MMAEIAGYGRLMEANEEATLEALLRHHVELLDPAIASFDGRIFKDMGDAFLVEFRSSIDSVECAIEIQTGMAVRNASLPLDRHIRLRLGINLGDVIVDGDDLHGDDINAAARLSSLAAPGSIICSEGIRHQVGSRIEVGFTDLGLKRVKNISYPIHVFGIEGRSIEPPARPRAEPHGHRGPGRTSVAVLPFANLENNPEQDFLSDGITEDIITDLSKVSELFVLSRNAVFRHKGRTEDMERVARELGVSYLVHGSVRHSGERVRVAAQLIEGTSGGNLWSERYDREFKDVFALQDEITTAIVDQLKIKLLPQERQDMARAPTINVEAYTCYLRGREFFYRGSKPDYLRARRCFEQAIELDPNYARAYAGLADCNAFLYMDYNEDTAAEVLRQSERALALEPGLVEALASHGLAFSVAHRYEEAEADLRRAIDLDPDSFEARFFAGRSYYAQGRYAETAEQWERAAEVKPDDYQALILLNQVYTTLGRPREALRSSQKGVERAEREAARTPNNPRPAYFLATALAKLGQAERAEAWARTAIAIAPDDYLTLYNIACFYSVGGRADAAFELLGRLIPLSNADMRQWILNDADFAPLHGDRRWTDVRAQATASGP
jgi:adenylate cyclase